MANSSTHILEIRRSFETQRVRRQKHMVMPSGTEQTLRKNGFLAPPELITVGSSALNPSILSKA